MSICIKQNVPKRKFEKRRKKRNQTNHSLSLEQIQKKFSKTNNSSTSIFVQEVPRTNLVNFGHKIKWLSLWEKGISLKRDTPFPILKLLSKQFQKIKQI